MSGKQCEAKLNVDFLISCCCSSVTSYNDRTTTGKPTWKSTSYAWQRDRNKAAHQYTYNVVPCHCQQLVQIQELKMICQDLEKGSLLWCQYHGQTVAERYGLARHRLIFKYILNSEPSWRLWLIHSNGLNQAPAQFLTVSFPIDVLQLMSPAASGWPMLCVVKGIFHFFLTSSIASQHLMYHRFC